MQWSCAIRTSGLWLPPRRLRSSCRCLGSSGPAESVVAHAIATNRTLVLLGMQILDGRDASYEGGTLSVRSAWLESARSGLVLVNAYDVSGRLANGGGAHVIVDLAGTVFALSTRLRGAGKRLIHIVHVRGRRWIGRAVDVASAVPRRVIEVWSRRRRRAAAPNGGGRQVSARATSGGSGVCAHRCACRRRWWTTDHRRRPAQHDCAGRGLHRACLASIGLPLAGGPLVQAAGFPTLAVVAVLLVIGPAILAMRLTEPRPGQYAHPLPA